MKGINETANTIINEFNISKYSLSENYVEPIISVLPPVMRLRFRFSKKGIIRFISHLEQIEVFRRTARRSGLPVAFSAGFNPQIKSSYGPPLSVGHESSSEYMELYFTQKINVKDAKAKFSKVLPNGFCLLDVKKIPLVFPSIDILSNIAEYEIKNINILQEEIDKFLLQDSIIVKKIKKGRIIELDAKPLIKFLKNEKNVLKLQLRFNGSNSIKPEVILRELLENYENYSGIYNIERTKLYVEMKNGMICEP
jgi:radical SAM-linked protein